jgi:hypothetical protein
MAVELGEGIRERTGYKNVTGVWYVQKCKGGSDRHELVQLGEVIQKRAEKRKSRVQDRENILNSLMTLFGCVLDLLTWICCY